MLCRKSVEYTQQTMSESLQRVKELDADFGGTEILQPLQAIYRQPFQEGHPRQVGETLLGGHFLSVISQNKTKNMKKENRRIVIVPGLGCL